MKVPYADFSCPIVLLSMRSWPLSFVCHIGANGSPIHGIGQQSCPLKQHNRRVVFSKSHAMSGRYSPIPKHESVSGTLYLNRFKFLGPCGPASRANDKKICIWDTSSWALLTTFKNKCVHTVTFSLDSTVLVLGGMGRWMELWDTESWTFVRNLECDTAWRNSVKFSPDGSRIVSGSSDETMRIWRATSKASNVRV